MSGRPFTDSEMRTGTGVCLIGETVRQQFFGAGDPEGEIIRVNRTCLQGHRPARPKGYTGFGQDQDNVVLMPLHAFQRRIAGNRDIDTIYVAADDGTPTTRVQPRDRGHLCAMRAASRPTARDDFAVRDMTQIADAMASATTTMTGMLGAVAGVSLLVGGIGIMNIMLVSVTERTREIGIRLAIGAHEKHILIQFLVEATVLSLLGGLIGIALGLALAGAARLQPDDSLCAQPGGHPARRRLLGADRHGVRLLPGAARRPARPDRRAAARIESGARERPGLLAVRTEMPLDQRLHVRHQPVRQVGGVADDHRPLDLRLGLGGDEGADAPRDLVGVDADP